MEISALRRSIKSITYFQRQDFFSKDFYETPKVYNKYQVINSNPHNFTFERHQKKFEHIENSTVERLQKSCKSASIFEQKACKNRTLLNLNKNIERETRQMQKSKSLNGKGQLHEVKMKEENYLHNEIIEHILNTKHHSRIEWERIKVCEYSTILGYAQREGQELQQRDDCSQTQPPV